MLICLSLVLTVITKPKRQTGEVWILNKGDKEILRGEIEICGQLIYFDSLKSSTYKSFIFHVNSDSHYKIILDFSSGKRLARELGYVTNGLNFRDTLIVTNGDIIYKHESLK